MIALQREVFLRNQQRINQAVFGYTAAYKRYEDEYHAATARYQTTSSFDDLLDAVTKADIVYVGDYHTLAQAQRTVLRLLRRLPDNYRPTLAVEFVEGRYQAALDAYVKGKINEATFLRRIRHDPTGVFGAWQHFKPMFDFARENQMPMLGIDSVHGHSTSSIQKRDTFAAKVIVDGLRERKPMLVHMGELHVSPTHLPALVDKLYGKPLRKVIIYQNCEEIYWQLEKRGLEHEVDVTKVKANQFCVITTPPIVCQQSYLNWLDNDDEMFEDAAPEKRFKEFVRIIAKALDIRIGNALDSVIVSSVVDTEFFDTLSHRGKFSTRERKEIERQILRSESYFIPKAKMVYLGKLSINHGAEEASHFLKHICGGDDEPRYLIDAFYSRVMNETIGFLGSKLINHKRKCPHFSDFARVLKDPKKHDPFLVRISDYLIKHRKMETGKGARGLRDVYSADADTFNAVTHALGYIAGDKLYYALVQGIMHPSDVRALYYDRFEEDGTALTTYLALVSRLAKVKLPKRAV